MWVKNNEVIILNDLKIFWFFGFRTPVSKQGLPTVPGILMGNYLIVFLLYCADLVWLWRWCLVVREGYGIIWQANVSIRLQRCSHWESWQDKLNIKTEIKFLTILRERSDDNNAEGSSQSSQSHRFSTILFYSTTSLSNRKESQNPW